MMKNLWSFTKFYCGNHAEPIPMIFKQGPKSIFYSCPEYAKRYQGEKGCPNRISIEDAEKILDVISERKEKDQGANILSNLTNYHFTVKGIECRVIRDDYGCLSIAVKNKRAFVKR